MSYQLVSQILNESPRGDAGKYIATMGAGTALGTGAGYAVGLRNYKIELAKAQEELRSALENNPNSKETQELQKYLANLSSQQGKRNFIMKYVKRGATAGFATSAIGGGLYIRHKHNNNLKLQAAKVAKHVDNQNKAKAVRGQLEKLQDKKEDLTDHIQDAKLANNMTLVKILSREKEQVIQQMRKLSNQYETLMRFV